MQRTHAQTIQIINQLPTWVGDIIWSFYYQRDKTIGQNHQKTIDEFKNLIKLTIDNVDYINFKKNKNHIKYTLKTINIKYIKLIFLYLKL